MEGKQQTLCLKSLASLKGSEEEASKQVFEKQPILFQEQTKEECILSSRHAYSTQACSLMYSQRCYAGTHLHMADSWFGEEIFGLSPALPLQGHWQVFACNMPCHSPCWLC